VTPKASSYPDDILSLLTVAHAEVLDWNAVIVLPWPEEAEKEKALEDSTRRNEFEE